MEQLNVDGHIVNIEEKADYYNLFCRNEKEEMGFLNFSIKENNTAWLWYIKTYTPYQHKGIGTSLIKTMLNICQIKKVRAIEGTYAPENEHARQLYEKMGFNIPNKERTWENYDETWTLSKIIDENKLINLATNVDKNLKSTIEMKK